MFLILRLKCPPPFKIKDNNRRFVNAVNNGINSKIYCIAVIHVY